MRPVSSLLLAILVLMTLCALCSGQDEPGDTAAAPVQPQPLPVASGPPAEYKIQPDDAFRMTVWGEPNLTVEQVVDPQGYVNVPLAGPVLAKGLTQQQLIEKITESLSNYLVDPKVQIAMIRFQMPKVHVLGQVNRPGLYEMKIGDRVMEAIAKAGSFTDMAYLEGATITHRGSEERVPLDLQALFYKGDMTKNIEVVDGDTIYIPEDIKNRYYVLGEVMRPGMYRLKEEITVMDAITTAGGPNPRGTLKATSIIRGDAANPERIELDVTKLLKKADMSQNVKLQPGDVVYVPETSRPDWNKIASVVSAIVNTSYLFRIWGL